METIEDLDPILLPLGFHPLHIAAIRQNPEVLRETLRGYQADVDVQDTHGRTPLLVALQNGRAECAKLLIRHGAKISESPSGSAVTDFLTHPPGLSVLEELVCEALPLPSFALLAELLPAAAADGNALMVRNLIYVYGTDANYCDLMRRTALHYACQNGHLECVQSLLELGADVHVADSCSSTPLHLACSFNHLDVVRALTDSTSTTDASIISKLLNAQNALGQTPVHIALYGKRFEIAIYLLGQYQSHINLSLSDSNGHSVSGLLFMLQSIRDFIPQVVRTQLPCLSQQEATWLLHDAISDADLGLVEYAISQGADVHCRDFMQHTPLLLASRMGFLEACRVLVAHGASACVTDPAGNGPLHYAAQGNHIDTFAYFLSHPDVDMAAFYASYQSPLTLPFVRALVASLEKHRSLPRPQNWTKWLCLVTPSADRDAYTKFVQLVCPSNWVEILADPSQYLSDDCSQGNPTHAQHTTLDVYTPGDPYVHPVDLSRMPQRLHIPARQEQHAKHCPECSRAQHKLTAGRHLRSAPRRVLPKHHATPCTMPQVPPVGHLATPPRARPLRTGLPFSRPAQPGQRHYPLHTAVLSKNEAALEYVLSCARGSGGKAKLMDMVDSFNCTVYELMLQAPEVFGKALQSVQQPQRVSNRVSSLDWTTVLCYLIVQCGQHVRVKSKRWSYQSKIATWPQWCYTLKMDEYCKTVGLPKSSLEREEDRIRMFEHLLREESLDLNDLICTAVEHNCEWAVHLILDRRSPHLDGCLALCEAVSLGHFTVVSELVRHGFTPSAALQGDHAGMLSDSLLVVARRGRWEEVLDIVTQLPPLNTVVLMKNFKELLRMSLADREGQEVASLLLKNFVSLLCSQLTSWSSLDCELQYSFLSMLRVVERYLAVTRTLGTVQRLISFCCSRQHTIDTVLNQLCSRGCYEEVKLLVECSEPGTIQQVRDSMQLTPHFYAIYGGHLDVLMTEGFDFPFSSSPVPAYIGALLYISLAPRVKLATQTQFATGGREYSWTSSMQSSYVHYTLDAVKHGCCSFSTLYKDPALVDAFLKTALMDLHGDACSQLLYAQGEHLFHPLLLVCLIPNLVPLLPLLNEMKNCLQDRPIDISKRSVLSGDSAGISEGVRPTMHPLQAVLEDALSMLRKESAPIVNGSSRHIHHSVLDLAVSFASAQTRRTGATVLEDILIEYAHCIPLVLVHKAAKKGMWKVVDVASRRLSKLQQVWGFYTLDNKEVADNYYDALATALRQGKMVAAASIYDSFLLAMEESESCKQEWGNKLLHLAIKYSLLDRIGTLMHDDECIRLGKRRLPLVEVAAYYGRREAVQFLLHSSSRGEGLQEELFNAVVLCAAKQNHCSLLEYLQSEYNNVLHDPSGAGSGYMSFWCQVLLGAVEGRHQILALRAAESIPAENWDQLTSHPAYFKILHWCGYWGLDDLFRHIPFAAHHIFVRHNNLWASAWESAVANGHIGALCSRVPDFPCFPEDPNTWIDGSFVSIEAKSSSSKKAFVDSLLTGSFHQMMMAASANPFDQHVASNDLCSACERLHSSDLSLFYYGCRYAVLPIVEACLVKLGKLGGRVLEYLHEMTLIHQVCKLKGSFPVLKALLKVLCDAGLTHMANSVNKVGDTPLVLASRTGEVDSITLLLQCVPESAVYHVNSCTGDCLLHEAVMGGSCEVVKVLCHAMGSDAIKYCFMGNRAGVSPLQVAFALGHHDQAAQLITMLPVRDERVQMTTIADTAREAFGWFSLLMRRNSVDTSHMHFRVSLHYLSKLRKCHTVKETLEEALKSRHSSLALTIVEASAGFALGEDMLGVAVLDPQVLPYMNKNDCIPEKVLKSRTWAYDICSAIMHGRADDAIRLTQFVLSRGVELDSARIFEAACTQSDSCFMRYFLQSQLYNTLSSEALLRGLGIAAAFGKLEIVLLIRCRDHELTKYKTEDCPCLPPLAGLLLTPALSHENLLYALFHSTVQGSGSLPMQWLTHQWTQAEVECVYKLCCEDTTEHNPWQVPTSPNSSTELHIEWDSFASAMSTSSHLKVGTAVTSPFLIEAIVFSPTVLGRLLDSTLLHSTSAAAEQLREASSLTLSCGVWPANPTFEMKPYGHAHITLSYIADNGMILFPGELEPVIMEPSPEPRVEENLSTSTECMVRDCIADFAHTIARRISKLFKNKLQVYINLDRTLAVVDQEMFNKFAVPVTRLLGDCHDAIRIASKAAHWTKPLSSIDINVTTVVESSDLKVSFSQNTLIMEILVGENADDYWRGWFESLIAELAMIELEYLKGTILHFINTTFLPKIRKLTKCTLNEETVILCAVHDDHQYALNVLAQPYFRKLNKIKSTLMIFCDMVEVLASDSNCLLLLNQHMCSGFSIVLTKSQQSEFYLQSHTPQLHINPFNISSKAYFYLYRSILHALFPQGTNDPGSGYIAPFASYVDPAQSQGLRYPVQGIKNTYVVKFVDYTNSPLTAAPQGRCTVKVSAAPCGKPSGKCLNFGHSDIDWSCSSLSVKWKPRWYERHKVAIQVNGLHISGSPWVVRVSRRAEAYPICLAAT